MAISHYDHQWNAQANYPDATPEVTHLPASNLNDRSRPIYEAAKRAYDVFVSIACLIACAPFMLLVALLIRLTSRGPIIFRQSRSGRFGQPFVCYKFRTMYDGAETQKPYLRPLNDMRGPTFKLRNDPRVTPLGRLLRKTSVDELPQFFNVLKGDMSIVGPRPLELSEIDQCGPVEQMRLLVKPGITCFWQVSGRSDIDFDEWMAMDLDYIRRRGFALDLELTFRTLPAVLSEKGAR